MGKRNMPEAITKSKILLVEGKDEVNLFTELLVNLDLTDIQVIEVSGKDKFPSKLEALVKKTSGYSKITSIGIVRDADDDPGGAFQSVCDAMSRLDLPKPKTPLQPVTGPPQITVMIVPDSATRGMIENVCLASVSDDPAMACVDQYFECLAEKQRVLSQNAMPKREYILFYPHGNGWKSHILNICKNACRITYQILRHHRLLLCPKSMLYWLRDTHLI